jgi:hypothetical protein
MHGDFCDDVCSLVTYATTFCFGENARHGWLDVRALIHMGRPLPKSERSFLESIVVLCTTAHELYRIVMILRAEA